ncbi:MAG TPA: hypothetical protein VGP71_01685 [Burkholderiales bacterium]|nr:hypothetical protein [Burkholderiales bacterium]
MTRSLKKVKESLRQTHDFAAGVLIGSAAMTPVFAAADTTFDDMRMPVLVGSLVLLLIGLLLKATRSKKTASPPQPPVKEFSEGIGQYRLQLGRGDAA